MPHPEGSFACPVCKVDMTEQVWRLLLRSGVQTRVRGVSATLKPVQATCVNGHTVTYSPPPPETSGGG